MTQPKGRPSISVATQGSQGHEFQHSPLTKVTAEWQHSQWLLFERLGATRTSGYLISLQVSVLLDSAKCIGMEISLTSDFA